MVYPMQAPQQKGKENTFIEGKKEVGRALVSKKSMYFHWLSPSWKKKRSFYTSCWALLLSQGVRGPLSGLLTVFN